MPAIFRYLFMVYYCCKGFLLLDVYLLMLGVLFHASFFFSGMAQFVSHFAEPGDPEYAPPIKEAETPAERKARIHAARLEKGAEKAAEELQKYDPTNDPNVSGDPYKTLFVARLNYETTESRIKREFESYGPIKRVGIFEYNQAGLVRGYATTFSLTCHAKNLYILFKNICFKNLWIMFLISIILNEQKKMSGNEKISPISSYKEIPGGFSHHSTNGKFSLPIFLLSNSKDLAGKAGFKLSRALMHCAFWPLFSSNKRRLASVLFPELEASQNISAIEKMLCFSATLALVVMHLAIRSPMIKRAITWLWKINSKDMMDIVRMVADKVTNKPRGYAFIEYMHTRDMKAAYKQADGRKLDGRRVLVDVERGRTVPNWRPRRLGGGLGTTRVGGEEVNQKHSGREVQQSGGSSRSEEPRTREDRQTERDREVSRERGRDKERDREKSRERSHDKPRDRDHREDRHHRDRERERDRDKERERGRDRDRDRTRDRGRDRGRDYERDRERDRGRDRDRTRDRERDYEVSDHDRGRSHDRDESKHERDRLVERDYDHAEPEDDRGWYEQPEQGQRLPDAENDPRYDHYEHHRSRGPYDPMDVQGDQDRYDQYPDRDHDRYDQMEDDDYHYDRGTSESREKEREYRRSERSVVPLLGEVSSRSLETFLSHKLKSFVFSLIWFELQAGTSVSCILYFSSQALEGQALTLDTNGWVR
ncbi:LOW QUALITY PROTEIN: hypothetical protein NC653_018518 [Populus alba x Populus x berolinensis]|uniref:U1 small nuclear ribonucleoprotein 70 kDa n=1 Tax=Populus alba x Populus x berolinensis TaxID=444605 RepID=A0AAD6QGQ7_9ROSI|nr:LOW QUALITY PROTEIN: hypothetical protein NC653_018518 [Populus alba x Populus x berolinensis]